MLTQIEAALIAELKTALPTPILKTVASHEKADVRTLASTPLPAAYVQLTGGQFEKVAQTTRMATEWVIWLLVRNMAGKEEGRTLADVGSYALAEAVLASLTGNRLGNIVDPLKPEQMAMVEVPEELAIGGLLIYTVTFSTKHTVVLAELTAALDDLHRIGTTVELDADHTQNDLTELKP